MSLLSLLSLLAQLQLSTAPPEKASWNGLRSLPRPTATNPPRFLSFSRPDNNIEHERKRGIEAGCQLFAHAHAHAHTFLPLRKQEQEAFSESCHATRTVLYRRSSTSASCVTSFLFTRGILPPPRPLFLLLLLLLVESSSSSSSSRWTHQHPTPARAPK